MCIRCALDFKWIHVNATNWIGCASRCPCERPFRELEFLNIEYHACFLHGVIAELTAGECHALLVSFHGLRCHPSCILLQEFNSKSLTSFSGNAQALMKFQIQACESSSDSYGVMNVVRREDCGERDICQNLKLASTRSFDNTFAPASCAST